jgi:hypothetical protein
MELPREDALRWLVGQYARLRHAHGEAIGDPELLLPTGRHFPDPFTNDGPSVARLLARLVAYAPLSEGLDVRLRFVEPEDAGGGGGGCGTGSCGGPEANVPKDRVIEAEDAYLVELPTGDVGHPTLLTTSLARSVGSLVLLEAGEEVQDGMFAAVSEVAASVCGAGVLLTSGAYVYGKSCGGVRMHQHTHLSVEEHATLLAIFCSVHGIKPAEARAHLDTTQREAFSEGWAWVTSNDKLMSDLRVRPELLADGVFAMEPVKGVFGRLFGKRASRDEGALVAPPVVPKKKRERTPEEERRLAEAKALVDQALRVHEEV